MKYFKSATAYRMVEQITGLERLSNSPVHECAPGQVQCHGWENPMGSENEHPWHTISASDLRDKYTILCLVTVKKNIKPATIRREVDKIVKATEKAENRKVERKERIDIKENVVAKALPAALSEEIRSYAYIDWANNMLVVCEHSVNKCDYFLNALRDAIGSLKIEPLRPARMPDMVMNNWLQDNTGAPGVKIRGDATFKNPTDISQTATVRHVEIDGAGVAGLLEDGMVPQELSLQWHLSETSHVDFKVTETVTLKGIAFSDDLLAIDDEYEDFEQEYDASMLICCSTITAIINKCFGLFGGVGE